MYRKSGCIVIKKTFLQGRTDILHRKRGFLYDKIVLCISNPFVYLKSTVFTRKKTEILHRKRGFLKEKIVLYIENRVLSLKNTGFIRKV